MDANWGRRVSQDELGNRILCESAMVRALLAKRNVVIDRCNFDKKQRQHWIGKYHTFQRSLLVEGWNLTGVAETKVSTDQIKTQLMITCISNLLRALF